ncbi:MAG TPA: hypothetical protein VHS09_05140 [Polyangiaceae bacterium]|nr:hypothetical protein [Polyangiaceae bacterium]
MNKAEKANRNRQMIAGLQKNHGPKDTILVNGVLMKQSDAVTILQAPIVASDVTTTSEAAFHKAVADESAADKAADETYKGLKATFLPLYAASTPTLADYGISVTVRREPTAATKAVAAEKRKATLAVRGVTGKRKRATITAPPPATTVPAAPATTQAPAATPPPGTTTTPKP